MSKTLTALYDTYDEAKQAVTNLEAAGIPHSDISIIATDHETTRAGTGAGVGAVLGGGAGLLAGLGIMAIPGLGPVVAAGWLAATLAGAAAGAAGGGIVGSLVGSGVSESDAHVYAEGVRRGGSLVTARVAETQVGIAREILSRRGAVDVATRRDLYEKEGWKAFDPEAIPYTPPQVMGESDRIPRRS